MKKRMMLLVAAALIVAGVVVVFCAKKSGAIQDAGYVAQRERTAQPTPAAAARTAAAQPIVLPVEQIPTVRGTKPYVLTSVKPFQKSLRLAVEAMGARTVSVISRNELLVEATSEVCKRLAADSRFEEVSEFTPSSKVQPELAELIKGGAKSVDVSLVALAAEDRQIVISCLEQGGGEMLTGCINERNTIRAKLPADLVASLSGRGDVRWMESFVRPQVLNDLAISSEAMSVTNVWDMSRGLGLTGAGQAVSTSDTGIDTGSTNTMHRDLAKRVKDIQVVDGCYDYDNNGHGTHTAGSIVGDGTMSTNQIRGTAYAADLYAWFCGGKDGYVYTPEKLGSMFVNGGAWTNFIHSASWGSNTMGQYDSQCADIDRYVWEHPDYLPVYSAGNSGDSGCTICSPAASKNVLTVGATQNARPDPLHEHDGYWGNGDPTQTAAFSSRGPCLDGRTKPDISAPGVGIVSTRSRYSNYESYGLYEANTNYAFDSGTSMSCPLTAGAVALVRQWLVEKKHFDGVTEVADGVTNKIPTAALMKAVIMGGAKGAVTPNNDQGWGRVDLADTLAPTNGCAVMLLDRIPFDEGYVTNIVIQTTNEAPLDVQLVWIDAPGSASGSQSASKLINDIDLLVESHVSGQNPICYGNGGDEPDSLNNAESVHIVKAAASTYVIGIDCRTILYDHTQGGAAALYIRGAFDPKAQVEEPEYVHLKKANKGFMSLRRALQAVEEPDETVELLDWVHLDKSVTLTNSCTLVATNENTEASSILRYSGATLTITNATLALSNVFFRASDDPVARVLANGCLKLGQKVELGLDAYHVAITTADAGGFELAGPLTRPLLLHCDAAMKTNEIFGAYSCDLFLAENCATNIVCADDVDRITRGRADPATGKLVWQEIGPTSLPMEEASGYFVKGGKNWKYAQLWKGFVAFTNAFEHDESSAFIVRKDGKFDVSFPDLTKPLMIYGEGMPQPIVTASGTSGFRVNEGGSLVISNLVFTGYEDADTEDYYGFIGIDGGSVTLEKDAVLDGLIGAACYGSGVIDLNSGTMTMREGASIINCQAQGGESGSGFGGAIYVLGESCTLNLAGGVISNCAASAESGGGGVYVGDYLGNPTINIGSTDVGKKVKLSVVGNRSGVGEGQVRVDADDIYFWSYDIQPQVQVTGPFEGWIGLRYYDEEGNMKGDAFATYAEGIQPHARHETAACFFSDETENLYGTVGDGNTFIWEEYVDDGQCSPLVAVATVYRLLGDGSGIDWDVNPRYYATFGQAVTCMVPDTTNIIFMTSGDDVRDCLFDDIRVPSGCQIIVTTDPNSQQVVTLHRYRSACIKIPENTALSLTDIVFDRDRVYAINPGSVTNALFDVDGGTLEIASGACISNILGNASRDAGAIAVYNGGLVAMRDGSRIVKCQNCCNYKMDFATADKNYGCGGAILVDNGTACLYDGEITDCLATRGGGVYASNGSQVYVSGNMRITGNKWQNTNGVHKAGNVYVADDSSLVLDDSLTGKIGTGCGYRITGDSNLVATVWSGYLWTNSIAALASSATNFVHDVTGETGVAVTNGTDALIVWCGAVKDTGTYIKDDKTYYAISSLSGSAPVTPPEATLLPILSDSKAVSTELAKINDAAARNEIATLGEYNAFASWAASVEGGVEAVATSSKAYVSYEFGTTKLLTADPTVEIAEVANVEGGLTVSVTVKEGEDPVAVASAKVATMFQATSEVGDWTKTLGLTVDDITKGNATEVKFTVKPAGAPPKAFIRLKY